MRVPQKRKKSATQIHTRKEKRGRKTLIRDDKFLPRAREVGSWIRM